MTNDMWWSEIEEKYRNYFSSRMKNALTDYTIKFPTESDNKNPSYFPTVYFSEIAQTESGQDLKNEGINAVMETIEIQVVTNGSYVENKEITKEAVRQMKKLRFSATSLPIYMKEAENIRRSVIRFRRLIGADDSI